MPGFIFAYHGGKAPESPEEGEKVMAQWTKWFEEMGGAITDGGAPVGQSQTVSSTGVVGDGGANPLSGYTIVSADNIEAAIAMAKGCPMVTDGTGSVEVAEILPM